jgi:hypothetical protein
MEVLKDLFTGEIFKPSRRNQKFKTSKNRIDYHNGKAFQEISTRSFITSPLKTNHKILMGLFQEAGMKETYTREFLLGKGYNFSVMTHFESFDDKKLPALFNFIYLDLFENKSTLTIYRKS